jgi:hypothetical protein
MSDVSDTAPTFNKQFFRAAILVAILACSVAGTKSVEGYQHELVLIHLLSFSAWFGCSVWVSFVAGIVMFKNLPRHVFGRLQAKLFPAYFLFSAVVVAIAMVSANALGWRFEALGMILGTILLNVVYFEPETTRIMFLRNKVERRLGTGHEVGVLKPKDPEKANDPELKKLSKQFGMLHGVSTLLNLGALGVGCYWMNFCTKQIMSSSL